MLPQYVAVGCFVSVIVGGIILILSLHHALRQRWRKVSNNSFFLFSCFQFFQYWFQFNTWMNNFLFHFYLLTFIKDSLKSKLFTPWHNYWIIFFSKYINFQIFLYRDFKKLSNFMKRKLFWKMTLKIIFLNEVSGNNYNNNNNEKKNCNYQSISLAIGYNWKIWEMVSNVHLLAISVRMPKILSFRKENGFLNVLKNKIKNTLDVILLNFFLYLQMFILNQWKYTFFNKMFMCLFIYLFI